ncbi:MAG: hypothetical protein PHT58_03870 [Eubacteriales bacterium]|nr:hypothetical protein [Eubacteriales bacterium]
MSYILFGSKSTKTDYGFIVAPYIIPMPTVQTNFVEIPGRDGMLDLSEGFGLVRYSNRAIALTLYAVAPYEQAVFAFVNDVHGKRMELTFDRDASFFYIGRVSVDSIEKHDGYCAITVNVNAEPFKYKQTETTVSRTGSGSVSLSNLRMPVVPEVTASAEATLVYQCGGIPTTTVVSAGTHFVPTLLLEAGSKTVQITTTGEVVFTYREGAL